MGFLLAGADSRNATGIKILQVLYQALGRDSNPLPLCGCVGRKHRWVRSAAGDGFWNPLPMGPVFSDGPFAADSRYAVIK